MFLSEWREFLSFLRLLLLRLLLLLCRRRLLLLLLRLLLLVGKKLDDSSRLDVVEIARAPDMLLSLFPSWSG